MTWAAILFKVAGMAFLLPLILTKLPETDIVVWYVFMTMISFALLLDFGFAPTFIRLTAYCNKDLKDNHQSLSSDATFKLIHKVDDKNALLQYIWDIANNCYAKLAISAFFLFLIIGSFFVARPISQSSDPTTNWFAWFVVMITSSLAIYGNKYIAILHGKGLIAENQRVTMLCSLVSILAAALALVFSYNFLVVICFYQAATIGSYIYNKKLVKNHFSFSKSCKNKLSPHDLMQLKKGINATAWRSGVGILMSAGTIHSSLLVVANFLPPSVAASYMLAFQFIRLFSSLCQVPFYTKIPSMASHYIRKELDSLKRIAFFAELKSVTLFFIFSVTGYFLFPLFQNLFKIKTSLPNKMFWLLLCIGTMLERSGAMHIQLYSLSNKIIWHYLNGLSCLTFSVFLFLFWEKNGGLALPIAILASNVIIYFPISTVAASTMVGFNYLIKQLVFLSFMILVYLIIFTHSV